MADLANTNSSCLAEGDATDLVDMVEPMDFQEEELAMSSSSITDTKFDTAIGQIEDIIMEDDFQKLQSDFMEKNYQHFEDTEENKFIYMDIFKEYNQLIEKLIEDELKARLPGFDMEEFSKQLQKRKSLDGEIFEILLTFSDFISFKEMFLDFKAYKDGRMLDLSSGLSITPLHVPQTTADQIAKSAEQPTVTFVPETSQQSSTDATGPNFIELLKH